MCTRPGRYAAGENRLFMLFSDLGGLACREPREVLRSLPPGIAGVLAERWLRASLTACRRPSAIPHTHPAPQHLGFRVSGSEELIQASEAGSGQGYAGWRMRPSENSPSRHFVNKGPLARPLPLLCRLRAQPHRDVGRLQRLPHYPYQVAIQRLQVRLIPQFGREGF
jgi:hypothetical protein